MNPRNRLMYGAREVFDKYGVPPEALCDLMALIGNQNPPCSLAFCLLLISYLLPLFETLRCAHSNATGDSADNIPGVKGIGPKNAAALLNKYRSLEDLFETLDTESLQAADLVGEEFCLTTYVHSTKKAHALPANLDSAFTLDGISTKPKTTLKRLLAAPREDVLLFRRLIQLVHDIPTVNADLENQTSNRVRYVGERDHIEDMFSGLNRQVFKQPLNLLRQQYHKLDRIV
jgi:5'-3' exonuclease